MFLRWHIRSPEECVTIINTQISHAQMNACKGLGVGTAFTKVAVLLIIAGH